MTAETEPIVEYRQYRFAPPPGATDILLIRHGESAPARDDIPFPQWQGHDDPELASDGREQARRLADRLGTQKFAALYVSPLQRTTQTAAPLAARLGLTPVVVDDLHEVGLGEWEGGQFRKHVHQQHPLAVQMFLEERWDVIPGSEPGPVFAARVRGAIEMLAARHPDERIAVFCHGGVIGSLLAQSAAARGFAFVGADNGSISQLVVSDQRWLVRRFNDTAHLAG